MLPACPKIDTGDLERQKPIEAMGPIILFPEPPPGFELWEGEEQARWVVENWSSAAEAYSVCKGKRTGLIDWINQ